VVGVMIPQRTDWPEGLFTDTVRKGPHCPAAGRSRASEGPGLPWPSERVPGAFMSVFGRVEIWRLRPWFKPADAVMRRICLEMSGSHSHYMR
jgi:hypothetical protein